jgi:hypothetical protein
VSGRITAAERAALLVARAALEGRAASHGPADAIVFALGSAQLLQTPESAVDLERTRAESRMWRDRLWAEQTVKWDDELPPGGLVCADPECGQPVESEPCPEHSP